jgi:hypothetical protein
MFFIVPPLLSPPRLRQPRTLQGFILRPSTDGQRPSKQPSSRPAAGLAGGVRATVPVRRTTSTISATISLGTLDVGPQDASHPGQQEEAYHQQTACQCWSARLVVRGWSARSGVVCAPRGLSRTTDREAAFA